MHRRLHATAPHQRGLTLVGLMVGVAVGLLVVAGAIGVTTRQLADQRRLALELQLQQDLRAAMDLVTRELRRAGAVDDAAALAGVWSPGGPAATPSALGDVELGSEEVRFRYRRAGDAGPFGVKRDGGTLRTLLGGAWQELTDAGALRVTRLRVAPTEARIRLACARACGADAADTSCWPTLSVRRVAVEIEAESRHDARVRRALRSEVRLRNDRLAAGDGAGEPTEVACPD